MSPFTIGLIIFFVGVSTDNAFLLLLGLYLLVTAD